jgi:hypothetical protein
MPPVPKREFGLGHMITRIHRRCNTVRRISHRYWGKSNAAYRWRFGNVGGVAPIPNVRQNIGDGRRRVANVGNVAEHTNSLAAVYIPVDPANLNHPTHSTSSMSPIATQQDQGAHAANTTKTAQPSPHQDISKLPGKPLDRIWSGDSSNLIEFPGIPKFDDKLQQREWVKVSFLCLQQAPLR